MYLLILTSALSIIFLNKFTSHYVSINSMSNLGSLQLIDRFTSHYVSINSIKDMNENLGTKNLHPTMYLLIRALGILAVPVLLHLHPTMYLLIRSNTHNTTTLIVIYIPLCIY